MTDLTLVPFIPTQSPTYIVEQVGALYYARAAPRSGLSTFSNSDAYSVIQSAINSLTKGGCIHLAANTTFTLSDALTFNGGSIGASFGNQWILEGEGGSSVLNQPNSGKNCILISNGSSVILRDFNILMVNSAGYAVYGSNGGANECSIYYGRVQNVQINYPSSGTMTATSGILLINPWYSTFRDMFLYGAPASGGVLFKIVQNSTTLNYGNCLFDQIQISGSGNVPINTYMFQITGTNGQTTALDACTLRQIEIFNNSATPAGSHGIDIGEGVNTDIDFQNCDIEACDIAVNLQNGASGSHAIFGVNFAGGFMSALTSCIVTGTNTYSNHFRHMSLWSINNSGAIIVEGSTDGLGENVYEDVYWPNTAVTVTVGQGIFKGHAGLGAGYANRYFSRDWAAASVSDGGTIPHLICGTPRVVRVCGSVASQIVTTTGVDGTNITVAIKTTAGAAGTTQTVYCYASL